MVMTEDNAIDFSNRAKYFHFEDLARTGKEFDPSKQSPLQQQHKLQNTANIQNFYRDFSTLPSISSNKSSCHPSLSKAGSCGEPNRSAFFGGDKSPLEHRQKTDRTAPANMTTVSNPKKVNSLIAMFSGSHGSANHPPPHLTSVSSPHINNNSNNFPTHFTSSFHANNNVNHPSNFYASSNINSNANHTSNFSASSHVNINANHSSNSFASSHVNNNVNHFPPHFSPPSSHVNNSNHGQSPVVISDPRRCSVKTAGHSPNQSTASHVTSPTCQNICHDSSGTGGQMIEVYDDTKFGLAGLRRKNSCDGKVGEDNSASSSSTKSFDVNGLFTNPDGSEKIGKDKKLDNFSRKFQNLYLPDITDGTIPSDTAKNISGDKSKKNDDKYYSFKNGRDLTAAVRDSVSHFTDFDAPSTNAFRFNGNASDNFLTNHDEGKGYDCSSRRPRIAEILDTPFTVHQAARNSVDYDNAVTPTPPKEQNLVMEIADSDQCLTTPHDQMPNYQSEDPYIDNSYPAHARQNSNDSTASSSSSFSSLLLIVASTAAPVHLRNIENTEDQEARLCARDDDHFYGRNTDSQLSSSSDSSQQMSPVPAPFRSLFFDGNKSRHGSGDERLDGTSVTMPNPFNLSKNSGRGHFMCSYSSTPVSCNNHNGGGSMSLSGSFSGKNLGNASQQVLISRSESRGSIASLTSIVSLASSTSYLSPYELQQLIEEANQSLDQSGSSDHFVDVLILHREHMGGGIGITLAGGVDQEQKEIRIHKVISGSVAEKDGRAQKGDRVLSINGKAMHNLTHRQSVEFLKAPRPEVVLVISRPKTGSCSLTRLTDAVTSITSDRHRLDQNHLLNPPSKNSHEKTDNFGLSTTIGGDEKLLVEEDILGGKEGRPADFVDECALKCEPGVPSEVIKIELENTASCGLGFSLEGGRASLFGDKPITIKRVFKGGTLDRCGLLSTGDEILMVNDQNTEHMTHFQAWNFVKSLPDGKVTIVARKMATIS
ncbi:unnamed protein product [Gordionus sp. m RMFG-2023]|uniref:myb-like protein A isoform X2 n=1 Tax=Gordionus sp. m RMFG-2023 TaxID=3053472 RepID=UPI0030E4877F